MKNVLSWAKAHMVLVGLVVLAGAFIGWKYSQDPVSPYETTTVAVADLVQEVSVTGKVQSQESIDLAFEKGGRITSASVNVGSVVTRGDTLVRLDGADVSASLSQAEANLAFEEATLAKLLRGSRTEEINVARTEFESAQKAMTDANNVLVERLYGAQTIVEDSIFNKTDSLFQNPKTLDPQLLFSGTDSKSEQQIESLRATLGGKILEMPNLIFEGIAAETVELYLKDVRAYLDFLSQATNSAIPNYQTSQTTIDGWKDDISLARTNVNTALQNIVLAQQSYRGAESAFFVAENKLTLVKANATPEDISAQKAKISSARASIASYQAQLGKLSLIAPLDGVVTRQDAKRGAIAGAGTTLVSLQSKGAFKIEANIPEVDIAKISLSDTAKITLDAYGDSVQFVGVVSLIDPSERVIDGVPTYKVTLTFSDTEEKVRSGMTSNITIETDKKTAVLAVPARAVKDGQKIVRVLPSGAAPGAVPVDRSVETGLRSSDGRVEIVSGLSPGETVVTYEKVGV